MTKGSIVKQEQHSVGFILSHSMILKRKWVKMSFDMIFFISYLISREKKVQVMDSLSRLTFRKTKIRSSCIFLWKKRGYLRRFEEQLKLSKYLWMNAIVILLCKKVNVWLIYMRTNLKYIFLNIDYEWKAWEK